MIELRGKYNTAKVFTDVVEETALSQIIELCNQEFVKDSKIRIMPDCHAGAGCVIGTTMTIQDKIVPNLVGVDIGCGMETIKIANKKSEIDFHKLDQYIRENIPSGQKVRTNPHSHHSKIDLSKLKCYKYINENRAYNSIGTLGGGNHFIEMNQTNEGDVYLVIHSGSRYLGKQVAELYQKKGYKKLSNNSKAIHNLIKQLKAEGRQKDIESEVKKLRTTLGNSIPKHLTYVDGLDFEHYLHDMELIQQYAVLNRKAMVDVILDGMGFDVMEQFTTIHNYIDIKNRILRKGSISARDGEKILIPINMRDGSLICIGKGNSDWNHSAPHGAGRLMSRSKAKQTIRLEDFRKSMDGIFTTSIGMDTIDESAFAYKTMDDIVDHIGDTAEIIDVIKPIYNFKAGE